MNGLSEPSLPESPPVRTFQNLLPPVGSDKLPYIHLVETLTKTYAVLIEELHDNSRKVNNTILPKQPGTTAIYSPWSVHRISCASSGAKRWFMGRHSVLLIYALLHSGSHYRPGKGEVI